MALHPRLAALSPFGPIFAKELRVTARRKRSYWLRVIYLAFLLLGMLLAYTINRVDYSPGGVAAQAERAAQLGITFFYFFAWFCFISMCAIGPVLTSTAISSERLAKTLPVLLMTPISSWQIVSGKLFSRLLVALTLIGLSLPVLALVRLLGGVELWQMAGVLCICTATALSTAAMGLFYSTFLNRAFAAILLSYATILVLFVFAPFIMALTMRSSALFPNSIWLFAAASPAMGLVITSQAGAMRGLVSYQSMWMLSAGTQLGLALVLLLLSGMVLRRLARRAGEQAAPAAPMVRAAPVMPSAPLPLSAVADLPPLPSGGPPATSTEVAARAKARPPVSDNPILWRELRQPLLPRLWQRVVGMTLTLGLMGITYLSLAPHGGLTDADTQIGFSVVFNGLAWLLVAVLAATAISTEKESDTWTLLLATPVSGSAVVWGKVLGLLRRLLWPTVLMMAHFTLFTLTGGINVMSVLLVLWVIASFNSIWIATGLYLSLRMKRPTFAVIANLVPAVLIYLVAMVILAIIGEFAHDRFAVELVGWYAPYFYLVSGLAGLNNHNQSYDLPTSLHVDGSTFALVVIGVGCLHLLIAWIVLAATSRRFDRIVGRAPQVGPTPTSPAPLYPHGSLASE